MLWMNLLVYLQSNPILKINFMIWKVAHMTKKDLLLFS